MVDDGLGLFPHKELGLEFISSILIAAIRVGEMWRGCDIRGANSAVGGRRGCTCAAHARRSLQAVRLPTGAALGTYSTGNL